jgi:hypothetical protein
LNCGCGDWSEQFDELWHTAVYHLELQVKQMADKRKPRQLSHHQIWYTEECRKHHSSPFMRHMAWHELSLKHQRETGQNWDGLPKQSINCVRVHPEVSHKTWFEREQQHLFAWRDDVKQLGYNPSQLIREYVKEQKDPTPKSQAVSKCDDLGSDYFWALAVWGRETKGLESFQRRLCESVARRMQSGSSPMYKQAKIVVKAIDEAERQGFQFTPADMARVKPLVGIQYRREDSRSKQDDTEKRDTSQKLHDSTRSGWSDNPGASLIALLLGIAFCAVVGLVIVGIIQAIFSPEPNLRDSDSADFHADSYWEQEDSYWEALTND